MNRTVRTALIGCALCAGTLAGPRGSAAAEPQDAQPPAPAQASGPRSAEPFLGVVVPDTAVDLSSRFDSRLDRLEVQVGDRVHRGQVVARLDVRGLQQDLAAAQAQLQGSHAEEQAALAALAEARDKRQRADTPRLAKLGVFSQEEIQGLRSQERSAAARVEAARAQARERQAHVVEMQERLNEATVVAPFDGVVAACPVSPGSRVAAGQQLVRVNGAGGLKVRFAIPENAGRQLAVGAPVRVEVPSGASALAAVVESVAPEVDAAARMIFAVASFTLPPDVATGAVVRVRVAPPVAANARGLAQTEAPRKP